MRAVVMRHDGKYYLGREHSFYDDKRWGTFDKAFVFVSEASAKRRFNKLRYTVIPVRLAFYATDPVSK